MTTQPYNCFVLCRGRGACRVMETRLYKALYAHSFESGDRQMMHILIISLLIEKLLYLLRRQSCLFQIVSEFCIPRGGPFEFLILPWGRFLYTMIFRGRIFAPFEPCPVGLSRMGWFWMKLTAALFCKSVYILFLQPVCLP